MPVHDMAPYVERSLDSVLAQPGVDLDVVVVDDGSTDGSGDLVAAYARRHPAITLLRQDNAGVSAARNAAIEQCRGEFLTFVDPDDFLPARAWAPMLASLERSGSDFAVGMMERVDEGGRRRRPPLLARNHAEARIGVDIDAAPLMIADVFPCNKLFRMDFWRRAGLSFPVGVSYEDQVFAADAFLAARRFDVLTEVVYEWYIRGEMSSATHRRGRIDNLQDRIVTKQMALDRVRAHGNPVLVDTLVRQVLPIDMWEHFRAAVAPTTEDPDHYWSLLRDAVRSFWHDDTVPFELTEVPPGQRLMGWLVAQDRRADLAALIAAIDGPGVPVEDGRYLHPWRDEPGVPAVLGEVSPGR
ncbi:glycosyltransferase [Nocardioides caeni]|uniref:Glycosyltransferase n=2 Tax=Nocardioides caeni TaxID=574700 RepID=A0A4S8NAT5_9ACTN|nr:glycosyltransferase [Nocardioides caeni]